MERPIREIGQCSCWECSVSDRYREIIAQLETEKRAQAKIIQDLQNLITQFEEDIYYWKEDLSGRFERNRLEGSNDIGAGTDLGSGNLGRNG